MKTWFRNISEFIQALKAAGELEVVDRPVSRFLEISRLTDEQSKSPGGGKALFFPKVEESPFPAATNLFGSMKRICLAFGVDDLDRLGNRLKAYIEMPPPRGLKEILNLLPTAYGVTRFFPRRSRLKKAPCQEVVHQGEAVDLSQIPVLQCWPKDGGPFVTLPLVFTRSLESGQRNLGMYRLQVFDKKTTGMHWHVHKDGFHFYQEYCRAGKRMPVAVAIGADPATIYSAVAPMPRNIDELILAGFIRNRPVPMARCLTIDLEVPAEAEFVLEGYVEPGELRREGPFGDHTGYYSPAADYPVFHVTAVTHRRAPIYCTTLVGRPPMEDCYWGLTTERLFLPLVQTIFPEIVDYWLPWEGVFHNIVVAAIKKDYPGQARKVMYGLWGQGQMSFSKVIVVVDSDVDLKKPDQVLAALLNGLDPITDIVMARGVLDVLDHASPHPVFGSKIGLDLTRRLAGEPEKRSGTSDTASIKVKPEEIEHRIRSSLDGVYNARFLSSIFFQGRSLVPRNQALILGVEKGSGRSGRYFAGGLLGLESIEPVNILLLFDREVDLDDDSILLWKLSNNVDPERDIYRQGDRVVVDACIKGPMDGHHREWPEELTFDV